MLTGPELAECKGNPVLLDEKITLAVNTRLLIREIPLEAKQSFRAIPQTQMS